jgi:hypothetical protein
VARFEREVTKVNSKRSRQQINILLKAGIILSKK